VRAVGAEVNVVEAIAGSGGTVLVTGAVAEVLVDTGTLVGTMAV